MNYLRAVKQSLTRGGKIGFIQSAAESEMQRKLTKSEFDGLLAILDGVLNNNGLKHNGNEEIIKIIRNE